MEISGRKQEPTRDTAEESGCGDDDNDGRDIYVFMRMEAWTSPTKRTSTGFYRKVSRACRSPFGGKICW
jgi:hypothetical protein